MPFHPLIVHFPIALLLTATAIEIVNLFLKKDNLSKTGTILVVLGVLSGFVSLGTGDAAETFAFDKWGKGVASTVETHSLLAGISVILFLVVAIVKLWGKKFKLGKNLITAIVLVFCLAGTTTLAVTGHLGGKIVYQHDQLTSQSGTTAGN